MAQEKQEVVVSMPLYVDIPYKKLKKKPKRYYFNLNQYRNWHPHVNNDLKKRYKEIAQEFLQELKFDNKIELLFVLWKKDKRQIDRANPLCIHEKFFCDALTEFGCIPDDNDDFIEESRYRTGGIDRANPRVDIIIKELNQNG